MLRRFGIVLLPLLAATAIALAGCGSSNSPSNGAVTGGAGTGTVSHAGLTPSSPVNSPAAIKFLVQEGERGGLTPSQSETYISCFEKKLAAAGIKTFTQFHAKLTSLVSARDACIAQAKKG